MAAERGGCSLEAVLLPPEVRESLAELELELSEGDITQKGYEKKRAKLLARYIPLIQDPVQQLQKGLIVYEEPDISSSASLFPSPLCKAL